MALREIVEIINVVDRGPKGDDAPEVQIEYSPDSVTWYATYEAGRDYVRFSTDGGETWAVEDRFKGDKGWSPTWAIVEDNDRRVLQVTDWVGGEGTKPTTGDYIGQAGLVSDIAEAVDIRGPEGDTSSMIGEVIHEGDDSVARPTGYSSVQWKGWVEPLNATDVDTWVYLPEAT